MADHYYAVDPSYADRDDPEEVTVGTASAGEDYIEVRIPDGIVVTRQQAVLVMEQLARYFAICPSLPVLTG